MGLLPASGPCGTPVSAPPAVTTACRLHGHLGVRAGVPLGRTGAAWAHTCINTAVHTKLHRLLSLVCVLVGTALRELLNQGSHRGLSVWRDSPVDPSRPLVSFVPFFLFVSAVPTTTGDGTCATAVTQILNPLGHQGTPRVYFNIAGGSKINLINERRGKQMTLGICTKKRKTRKHQRIEETVFKAICEG